jgi:hypothetical protein
VLAAGCGANHPAPTPKDLVLVGSAQLVGLGGTTRWTAEYRLTDFSETDVTDQAQLQSSDPKVVSISKGGVLTAAGYGSVVISASYQSFSVRRTVQVVPLEALGLTVTTSLSFTAVGQTRQLVAVVRFNDNSTVDVSADTEWHSSDSSIVDVTASGALTTTGLGTTMITAKYGAQGLTALVTVEPPGTIVVSGRVRLPGNGGEGQLLGVAGFKVTNTDLGNSVLSDAQGRYAIVAAVGTRLTFEKTGFEPAELVVAGPTAVPAVQQLIRIPAGETATTTIFENDVTYDPSPSFHCDNCRLIRVVCPATGSLTVQLNWTGTSKTLVFWANGQQSISAAGAQEHVLTLAVSAGELLLYINAGIGNFVNLTVSTSFGPSSVGGRSTGSVYLP